MFRPLQLLVNRPAELEKSLKFHEEEKEFEIRRIKRIFQDSEFTYSEEGDFCCVRAPDFVNHR